MSLRPASVCIRPSRPTVRSVVVPSPATVFAQAARVRYGSERWSGELQQNLVQASAPSVDWSQASLGRTVATARFHFAENLNHAFLLEGDVGVADAQASTDDVGVLSAAGLVQIGRTLGAGGR